MRAPQFKRLTAATDIVLAVRAALMRSPDERPGTDCIPVAEFERLVRDKVLMDDDGFGRLVMDGRVVRGSNTYLENREIAIDGFYRAKIRTVRALFGDRAKIQWFNR